MADISNAEFSNKPDHALRAIPTAEFISRFNVEDSQTIEALRSQPVLCYLLGKVSEPQSVVNKLTGEKRTVRLLQEGSGMFGLTDKQDALEWKGIFNHTVGSTRHAEFLIDKLSKATPEQRAQLEALGYDFTMFNKYGRENIFESMLITHAGRRAMDENNWYGTGGKIHHVSDSYQNTKLLLTEAKAPKELLELLEVENHQELMTTEGKSGRFTNIAVALLTYADWTFGQSATPLSERFTDLREKQRASKEQLDVFETCGNTFEKDMNSVFGGDLYSEMAAQEPKLWETKIRSAYCSPSGLNPQEVFPSK
jgi:hypothetical protein